jgi:hypothetical protein
MSTEKTPAAIGASMRAGATGVLWTLLPHTTRPGRLRRVLVSPGNRRLKLRSNGPELGRRLVRPKQDHGEAYLQERAPSWIERPAPAKVASGEPPSSVNMSEAEAGPAVAAEAVEAGREAAVGAGAADAEGEEWL